LDEFKESTQVKGIFCRKNERSHYMDISSISSGWGSSACSACNAEQSSSQKTGSGSSNTAANKELSKEEKQEVKELKKRDTEVKAHEAAHVAAGGQYVKGGASFEYQTGPDGRKYAVGGEVPIDVSAVSGDPSATIRKMQVVKAAALAPAQPSGADVAIAAKASAEAGKAQADLMKEKAANVQGGTPPPEAGGKPMAKNAGLEQGLPEPIKNADKNNSHYASSASVRSNISIDIMA
jgi:hypothetical protein